MNPAVVSLKGYADVNRELLTAVIFFSKIFVIKAPTNFDLIFFSCVFGSIDTETVGDYNNNISYRFIAIQVIIGSQSNATNDTTSYLVSVHIQLKAVPF